jgi:hypothetical protein
MHSTIRDPWLAALFAALDDLSARNAAFDEQMELFETFDRLKRDVTATAYEVTSPFRAARRTGPT